MHNEQPGSGEFFRLKGLRIVPKQHGKTGETAGDWLKIEFFAPLEMIDALNNFVTEIGAQGAFQETL